MKIMEATLFCLHCNEETTHEITYAGQYLKSIKCKKCGNGIDIDKEKLMEQYKEDWVERIITKPKRLTKEMEQDFKKFIFSFPVRVLTKYYRVAKEVKEIKKD